MDGGDLLAGENAQGNLISEGPVSSSGYFGIGDVEVPISDIRVDSLWYNQSEDIISVSLTNIGTGNAGGFYITYYLLNELDSECYSENYEVWSYVDSISTGSSVITSSPFGVMEYLGGYGTYTVGVVADAWCQLSELSETNNTLIEDIDIVDPMQGVTWNIYRQDAGNDFELHSVADAIGFSDMDVSVDENYCYYVTQVKDDSESESSNTDCASPLAGNVIVDPYPNVEFSNIKAGTSSNNQVITITNGSEDTYVAISSIGVVGVDAEHFTIDYLGNSESFFVYDNVQIAISFSPQSVGQKAAQLFVSSPSGNVTLTLSGRGYLDPPTGLEAYGYDASVNLSWLPYGMAVNGDRVDNPFEITELPFIGQGTTEGFTDDYDISCPDNAPGSPDVVYKFESPGGNFDVGLCESGYDTKLYIYSEFGEVSNEDILVVELTLQFTQSNTTIYSQDLEAGVEYYLKVSGTVKAAGHCADAAQIAYGCDNVNVPTHAGGTKYAMVVVIIGHARWI